MSLYPIFDTHSHLFFPSCEKKLEELLADCAEKNVRYQVQVGCDEISSQSALQMAKSRENFYCTLGLHPSDVKKVGIRENDFSHFFGMKDYQIKAKNFEALFEWFADIFEKNKSKVAGFGETGFDLYHENSTEIFELQKISFQKHLELCVRFCRPFVLHSRNAKRETLDFLSSAFEKQSSLRGVWHCFSEDPEAAQMATRKYGLFLGIGGVLTYDNADLVREAVRQTPIEFLVTETDAPFLVPKKAKKQKVRLNSGAFLPEVIELIADLKGLEVEECAFILFENAKRLYGVVDLGCCRDVS